MRRREVLGHADPDRARDVRLEHLRHGGIVQAQDLPRRTDQPLPIRGDRQAARAAQEQDTANLLLQPL